MVATLFSFKIRSTSLFKLLLLLLLLRALLVPTWRPWEPCDRDAAAAAGAAKDCARVSSKSRTMNSGDEPIAGTLEPFAPGVTPFGLAPIPSGNILIATCEPSAARATGFAFSRVLDTRASRLGATVC